MIKNKTNPDFNTVKTNINSLFADEISSINSLQQYLTLSYVEEVYNGVLNHILPVVIMKKNTEKIKKSQYDVTCEILVELFSEDTIKEYFYNCIKNNQIDENKWTALNIEKFYYIMTGRAYLNDKSNYFYKHTSKNPHTKQILELYYRAYKDIYNDYIYPISFVNETIKLINNKSSLKSQYLEFQEKYNCNYCSYIMYLYRCVMPVVSKEKFIAYLNGMVLLYKKDIPTITIQNLNSSLLQSYIFGYNWPLETSESSDNQLLNFNSIILSVIFPYIVQNYRNSEHRKKIYSVLNYTDDIKEKMEKQFSEFDFENYRIHSAANEFNIEEYDISGIPLKNICGMMDKYMDTVLQAERYIPSYRTFMKQMVDTNDIKSINLNKNCVQNMILFKHYGDLASDAKKQLFLSNDNECSLIKDIWIIYYKTGDNYKTAKLDFSGLKPSLLKTDLKKFFKEYIKDKHTTGTAKSQIQSYMIDCFLYLMDEYDVSSKNEIKEWMLLSYLDELNTSRHLSPSSIQGILSYIRRIFKYFNLDDDPSVNLSISHLSDHIKPTAVIPDDILVFLDNNIKSIRQTDVELIYRVLSETGWRFGDIKKITIDNISKIDNNDKFAKIQVHTSKTKIARIKHRLGDIIEDNISIDLYNDLIAYIKDTEKIRKKVNTKILFFRVINNNFSPISPLYYDRAINVFLKNNCICSVSEEYTHFSAMQSRKTVASNLINNNVSEADIQKKLGHISPGTTRKYYMEVERNKLAELNHEFYKKKFDIYMDEDKLKLFTEEERRILYVDFCLGKRQVELGECAKHPSEGSCISLGQTSCAKCPKLCTGKKYLDRWAELERDSKKILDMFVSEYTKHGIPESEYKKYTEYKQEDELHNYYMTVIEAIRKG